MYFEPQKRSSLSRSNSFSSSTSSFTQSQENVIQRKPKKGKKKSKIEAVEQEDTGASIQAPVKEGEQTPPQTTTAALSILKQKAQEWKEKTNKWLSDISLDISEKRSEQYHKSTSKTWGNYIIIEKTNQKNIIKSLEELEKNYKQIQTTKKFVLLLEKKLNAPEFKESNNEKYNKAKIILGEKLILINDLERIFFHQYRALDYKIDNQIKTAVEQEQSKARLAEFNKCPSAMFIPKELKTARKNLLSNINFTISTVDNLCRNMSKLLENTIAGKLIDEETINQFSNHFEAFLDIHNKNKNVLIQFQNRINNKEKDFQNFFTNYNTQVEASKKAYNGILQVNNQLNKLTTTIPQKQKLLEQVETNFQKLKESREKFMDIFEIYNFKVKEEFNTWIYEIQDTIKQIPQLRKQWENHIYNLFNDLQEVVNQALRSQNQEENNLNEDETFSVSQEHSSLTAENVEDILSEIKSLIIDYPESEQPFQVSGKSKKGKTISGKASKRIIPKVKYDKDGKFQYFGEYEVNDIGFFRIAQNTKLVRVEFEPQMKMEKREQLYAEPFFKLNQTIYRFDLLNSGNPDFTWAIETDKDSLSTRIHPFDEAVAYTRQALLTTPLAVNTGSKIKGAAVKDKTPFTLEKIDGVELMVSDGWGFIKASLAESLISEIRSKRSSTSTPSLRRPALPNTQMLQWLPQDNKLIFELVENGIKELSPASGPTDRSLSKDAASVQDLQKEKLYRAVTTGNFPVRVGTAMPVPGEEVVLPPGILPNNTKVALHRNPADTMNWTTGSVASENPLSEFITNMTALQYRWAGYEKGHQSEPFVFFKGLLGVIPDKNWPSKYQGMDVGIVVCSEDRKVDEKWKDTADIEKAKETEAQFMIEGDFAVSKLLDPDSLIGVPPKMMKNLSGDYDGDEVHALAQLNSPVLFQQIELQEKEKISNPKLDKDRRFPELSVSSPATQDSSTLLSNPFTIPEEQTKTSENPAARSLSSRLLDITLGNHLVGIWSTIADLLSTVNPLRLNREFSQEIGQLIVQKPLQNKQELWQYVGLGIKAGTDLAKTNLERTEFLGRKLTAQQLLEEGRKLIKFLVKEKKLRSPHKRRNISAIVDDIINGKRLRVVYSEEQGDLNVRSGHYGNLFEIMFAMDLYLEISRSGQNFTCKGDLAPTQLERATKAIEKARKGEITDQDVFIFKIYEILGNLKQILQSNYQKNKHARENGSLWMLLVIKELQPAKLRQDLYTQSSPTPAADLQIRYDNLLNQIQQLWHQFTCSDHEKTSATPPINQPSSVADNSYKEISIPGDGNCFFRAVAEGLSRQFGITKYDHSTLRQMTVKYMRENQATFAPAYLTDGDLERLRSSRNEDVKEQFKDVNTYDKYVKKMEKDGTWGGDTEAAALCTQLGKLVILHSTNQVTFMPNAINLVQVSGNHFNLLLPAQAPTASSS